MVKQSEERGGSNHEKQNSLPIIHEQVRSRSRRLKYWKALVIALLLALVIVTAGILKNFKSSTSIECYRCSWIFRSNASALRDDPCGKDQRLENSPVIKCNANEHFCGSLHLGLSFYAQGSIKTMDFAFLRGCFVEYPLKYTMNLDGTNRTYIGTREGNVYPNISNKPVNLTVIGKQCSNWDRCNSNQPKEHLVGSLLDSTDFFLVVQKSGTKVLDGLVTFLNEAKVYINKSQPAI